MISGIISSLLVKKQESIAEKLNILLEKGDDTEFEEIKELVKDSNRLQLIINTLSFSVLRFL